MSSPSQEGCGATWAVFSQSSHGDGLNSDLGFAHQVGVRGELLGTALLFHTGLHYTILLVPLFSVLILFLKKSTRHIRPMVKPSPPNSQGFPSVRGPADFFLCIRQSVIVHGPLLATGGTCVTLSEAVLT